MMKNLITSQTIGPTGGSIISDDVVIEIPSNALTASTLIELYSSNTENPYGDEENSDVFWLKSLPDQLNAPLKLSIRYSGSLTDLSFIGLGKYVMATSGQDTTLSETLIPAVDSSGFLQAIIPAGPVNFLKSIQYHGRYGIPFFSMSSYWYYQMDHFLIHFPGRYKSTGAVEALANGLEGDYDTLLNMGFIYNDRTSWPIDVTQLLIPDLKGLQASSSTLYVLITNYLDNPPLYNSTTNITLDMTVVNSAHT